MKEIAAFFKENGIRNTLGGEIKPGSIQRMLNNRRYIGEYSYKDVIVPNVIPAIVPQDLFDRVQDMMAKNKKAPARHKAEDDYLLTTKLFCGYCGAYLCGECGTSRSGMVHHYYKCVSVKKRRADCKKKAVRKEWIEDLVVNATMKMLMNDATVDAIVAALMELQNAENSLLPLYEKQLRDTNNAIRDLLSAIEQGLLTRSTKERLDELEAARDNLESKIACEKLSKPRISEEQLRFFLHRFRSMNVEQQSQRKMLIDTFVNAIFLYDDRLVITYNFHEGSETITLNDLHLVEKKNNSGSDIRLAGEPLHYPCFDEKHG